MSLVKTDPACFERELLQRRLARTNLHDYILYTKPVFQQSAFSRDVCAALDQFLLDVKAGKRPVLILQAPPQHGKSEMVSRKLPAYILAAYPELRIAAVSYAIDLARRMATDVRRTLASLEHRRLFPQTRAKLMFESNRMSEFNSPHGSGSYLAVGVQGPITGMPVDIGIIDDPIKNQEEALSDTTKESHWNWYESTFLSRFSEKSGQIVMATSWAEDDLPARIAEKYRGDPRLTLLRFPAINSPDETGYNPDLPLGALVPEFKSLKFLLEVKNGSGEPGSGLSDYWWSAMYQQSPKPIGGNVFKEIGIQYYLPKQLPDKFDLVIDSWDCTFKDTDGTDYVVGGKWGKKGANSYLLKLKRNRMSFTKTTEEVEDLANMRPLPSEILIEDKANGPAVIDFLKKKVPRLIPVEPDGSKLSRAHAVTSVWEAQNVWLPHPDIAPWVVAYVNELTRFPAAANDDQVDMTTQALRRLYPFFGVLKISSELLKRAAQRR
jgi:predicted phage terminase large subunit-like protein